MNSRFDIELAASKPPIQVVWLCPSAGNMAGLADEDTAALSALVADLTDHPQAAVVYQLDHESTESRLPAFEKLDTAGLFDPFEYVVRIGRIGSELATLLQDRWLNCPEGISIPSHAELRRTSKLICERKKLEEREELEDIGCVFEVIGSDGDVLGIRIVAEDGSLVGRCTQVFSGFGVTVSVP